MKKFKWEQEQIKDMKEYIARFGHGSAKLARQAQSKEKTLAKMVRALPLPCWSRLCSSYSKLSANGSQPMSLQGLLSV